MDVFKYDNLLYILFQSCIFFFCFKIRFVRFILVDLYSSNSFHFHNLLAYSPDGYLRCFKFFPTTINATITVVFVCLFFFSFVKENQTSVVYCLYCIVISRTMTFLEPFSVYKMPFHSFIAYYRWRPDSYWGFLCPKPRIITVPYAVTALYKLWRFSPI